MLADKETYVKVVQRMEEDLLRLASGSAMCIKLCREEWIYSGEPFCSLKLKYVIEGIFLIAN